MKLSERRCGDKHDAKPLWILICGELGCGANILADEFEGSEYIAQLETINAELLEALEKIADTSPNWMRKDAVADSERRMRQIAIEAIQQAKEKER